jgi:hypothetical protein
MPIIENSPSVMPGPIVALAPMVTPRSRRVVSVSSVTSEVSRPVSSLFPERGKRSLVKHRVGGDHAEVADRHVGADVDDGVDLDVVADHHVVGDVGLFADDAVVAELRAVTDVHPVPDAGVVAEHHPVLDESGRMDAGRLRSLSGGRHDRLSTGS